MNTEIKTDSFLPGLQKQFSYSSYSSFWSACNFPSTNFSSLIGQSSGTIELFVSFVLSYISTYHVSSCKLRADVVQLVVIYY